MLLIYLMIYFGASFLGVCSTKSNSNTLGTGKADRPVFILINSAAACLFFAAMNGFAIRFNGITLLYALGFSLIVLSALLLTLAVYRYASIPTVSVLRSAFTLLTTSLLGALFFSEKITSLNAARIVLLILSSVLIYFSQIIEKEKKQEDENRLNKKKGIGKNLAFFLILSLLVLSNCFTTLITKSFSVREDVTDANSYYFATNLILLAVGFLWLIAVGKGRYRDIGEGLRRLKPKSYFNILLQTVTSNICSLVTIPLVAMIDVAEFSAYTSAIGILSAAAASFCFREKQNVYSLCAVALAAASFLIGAV